MAFAKWDRPSSAIPARALANPERKTRIAEPAPRRDPDRRPIYVAPPPPPSAAPAQPVPERQRQAWPADPPRPSPPSADPATAVAQPKVCQWFLTQLGVYMNVPCDMVTASK